MYDKKLSGLERISQIVGARPDYVQGGGGNTSVKLDDELMAVKASGFSLNQITAKSGFVVVNYRKIKEFYNNLGEPGELGVEEKANELIKESIVDQPGMERLRPSVEAGFHSLLDRYVIHTHSVYANILCCSREGQDIARRLFDGNLALLWVPYVNPGFDLTARIKNAMEERLTEKAGYPSAVFMQNHGLITTAGNPDDCLKLHDRINNDIREYLNISETFPETRLEKIGEDEYESKTENIVQFSEKSGQGLDFLLKHVLYPDQLVYLNSSIGNEGGGAKTALRKGKVVYKATLKAARILDETFSAFIYVSSQVMKGGLTLTTMTDEQMGFITNWDSEKYRKKLAEKQK